MSQKVIWLWAVLLPIFSFVGQILCLLPAPRFLGIITGITLWFSVLTVFCMLIAVPASIFFFVQALYRWRRKGELLRGFSISVACLCLAALWFVSVLAGEYFRHNAFVRASHVGDQVVQALAQYKLKTGHYPEELGALVPEYLSALPYTGMIGYPEFTYAKDRNDLEAKPGSYELRINCPSGGINFDRFIYWPSQQYPRKIQHKPAERIGNWAYVHE